MVLLSPHRGTLFRCNITAAAMWAALCRHGGQLDVVAEAVAEQYHADVARVRADLDLLVEKLRQARLVRTDP